MLKPCAMLSGRFAAGGCGIGLMVGIGYAHWNTGAFLKQTMEGEGFYEIP